MKPYPLLKLEVISKQYERYGSYVYFPWEASAADTTSVKMKTRSADYHRNGIRLTNVVYYPGLRQLAFGYVYGDDRQAKYEIALLDADGQPVPGVLLVSGHDRFHARNLQKLNFMLEEPLRPQAVYSVVIMDEEGERAGRLDFEHEQGTKPLVRCDI